MFYKLYFLLWEYERPPRETDEGYRDMRYIKRGIVVITGSFIIASIVIRILAILCCIWLLPFLLRNPDISPSCQSTNFLLYYASHKQEKYDDLQIIQSIMGTMN